MALIHYYVHGRGRGHATRALAIEAALQGQGHRVRFFAGEDALVLLPRATSVISLPPQPRLRSAELIVRRTAAALRELTDDRADLVISDGDFPAVLAGRAVGRPVVAVGRGLAFSHGRRPPGIDRRRWAREAVKARWSSIGAHAVVGVSFVPIAPRSANVVMARPPIPAVAAGRVFDPAVVCYFRDENGGAILDELAASGENAVVFARVDPGIAGVTWQRLDRESFLERLVCARAVIASAGSQLIGECTELGVPLLALYDRRDHEQALNVALLRHFGLGDGVALADCTPGRVRAFLAALGSKRTRRLYWDAPPVDQAVADAVRGMVGVPIIDRA